MPIDFQPIQAPQAAATQIDFQPLEAKTEQPSKSLGQKAKDVGLAGFESAGAGIIEGAQAVGGLARNILAHTVGKVVPDSVNKFAGDVGSAVNLTMNQGLKNIKDDPEIRAVRAEYPEVAGAAETVGDIGTQMMLLKKPLGLAAKPINAGLSAAAPGLAAAPATTNAISQGLLGVGMGAAGNPEHPIKGALQGGLLGVATGALTGALGESVRTQGSIIQETKDAIKESGRDPNSLASLRTIQGELKSEGLAGRQLAEKADVKEAVNQQLSKIRPSGYVEGTSPIETIKQTTLANYPKVIAQNEANYKPINESTQTFQPSKYQNKLNEVQDQITKIKLPNKPVKETTVDPETGKTTVKVNNVTSLPENPTLNDMLSYRKQLDGTIKQAQAQAVTGKIPNTAVKPYYELRQALNQDIHDSAKSAGLEDQLNKAESFNQTNVQPFKIVNKNGDLETNPKAVNKIMNLISGQLQARRPNFQTIKDNAARLGPDGHEQLGWGLLENGLNRADKASGFSITTLDSQMTRMKASGLWDQVASPEQHEVFQGIRKIVKSDTVSKAKPGEQNMLGKALNPLTKSRVGIELLRIIGNPSTSAQTVRDVINQFVTGILVHGTSNEEKQ